MIWLRIGEFDDFYETLHRFTRLNEELLIRLCCQNSRGSALLVSFGNTACHLQLITSIATILAQSNHDFVERKSL